MSCIIEPAINVYTKEEYLERIISVRNFAEIIQFDVIDGIFARPGNYNDPDIVKNNLETEKIDLHFMVMDIDKEIDRWLKVKPKRIIIHVEQTSGIEGHLKKMQINKIKKGLAIAPFTALEKITPFVDLIDYLLVLSVVPGGNGQEFISSTIDRIKTVGLKYPFLQIGVDGGVQDRHLLSLKKAGVKNIVIGSSLFNGVVGENFKKFDHIVR
jgi:ribulose-phosphate 3-epimerase